TSSSPSISTRDRADATAWPSSSLLMYARAPDQAPPRPRDREGIVRSDEWSGRCSPVVERANEEHGDDARGACLDQLVHGERRRWQCRRQDARRDLHDRRTRVLAREVDERKVRRSPRHQLAVDRTWRSTDRAHRSPRYRVPAWDV